MLIIMEHKHVNESMNYKLQRISIQKTSYKSYFLSTITHH